MKTVRDLRKLIQEELLLLEAETPVYTDLVKKFLLNVFDSEKNIPPAGWNKAEWNLELRKRLVRVQNSIELLLKKELS